MSGAQHFTHCWRRRSFRIAPILAASGLAAAFAGACGDGEPGIAASSLPGAGGVSGAAGATAGAAGTGQPADPETPPQPPPETPETGCRPARSAYPIPARAAVSSRAPKPTTATIPVADLVQVLDSFCSSCHLAPKDDGGFSYTHAALGDSLTRESVKRILSSDPDERMPPGKEYGHPPGPALQQLADWLELWFDQGKPKDEIRLAPAPDEAEDASARYLFTPEAAAARTNIGDCIPGKATVGTADTRALDARFDKVKTFKDLPTSLADTDLFTFETAELAKHRTLHYAPTYQLWADDTGKERHVHVPQGKTIRFDPVTQQFDIPDGTRFYKTFLRKVTDVRGRVGYRKIETRIIVARKSVFGTDGTFQSGAVFGTYVWNREETAATLHQEPYRDGTPFRDRLIPVITDEAAWRKQADLEEEDVVVDRDPAAARTYAVPAAHRCVKCHRGSETGNFVLGFSPLQLNRRPEGVAGVYEPVGEDELSQAQRFIDYGLISNLSSPEHLKRLEDPTPDGRVARNAHELRAQAYMIGNCMHCHNPAGAAVVQNPELSVLDFRPGGIFEFPLSARSPRRVNADGVGMRYVTNRMSVPTERINAESGRSIMAPFLKGTSSATEPARQLSNLGPWESLLFRNTETPFTYSDDQFVYPHMPQAVPGHDCRAAEFMAKWMLSIPTYVTTDPLTPSDIEVPRGATDAASFAARQAADQRVRAYSRACIPALKPADTLDTRPEEQRDQTGATRLAELRNAELPDGIPDRPNWIAEDFTAPPGDWEPAQEAWQTLIPSDILEFHPRSELVTWLKSDFPYGLWADRASCDFSKNPRWEGALRPWMRETTSGTSVRDRVYYTTPGAAVYDAICSNCHGERADSVSNLGSTVLELSGGRLRVANFEAGIFGPKNESGKHLAFFDETVRGTDLGPDGALNYMVFMGLGGTTTPIPDVVLRLIAEKRVHGHRRDTSRLPPPSGNMLDLAVALCAASIPFDLRFDVYTDELVFDVETRRGRFSRLDPRIEPNKLGERDFWDELCRKDNPLPVRMLRFDSVTHSWYIAGLISREDYAQQAALNDETDPWCVDPSDERAVQENAGRAPLCPDVETATDGAVGRELAREWARRGSFNAGAAVYFHLKGIIGPAGSQTWPTPHDRCDTDPRFRKP